MAGQEIQPRDEEGYQPRMKVVLMFSSVKIRSKRSISTRVICIGSAIVMVILVGRVL